MPSTGKHLARALEFALRKLREEPKASMLKIVEETATQFNLGPLDEEWLLRELIRDKKEKQ
jgi:hypothetical protein